jgi:hypothetical protein
MISTSKESLLGYMTELPAKLIKFRRHPLELIKICHSSGIKGRGFTESASEIMFTFQQYPPFLNRQGEIRAPAKLVSNSGTKAAPVLGPGNRGCVLLSVTYRNVSAALSLLNKVHNSIYSTNQQLTLYVYMIMKLAHHARNKSATGAYRLRFMSLLDFF